MALLFDSGPSLSPSDFSALRRLINAHCGIEFADDARRIVERRLRDRLQHFGLDDFGAYLSHLKFHPNRNAELAEAVDLLVTNETYFFREAYQLSAFRDELLPQLRARLDLESRQRLTVWSAGCSTGEEVYTLAILIRESGLFDESEVRIYGSDISRRALAKARAAVYSDSSFRVMESRYNAYFEKVQRGRQVNSSIKAMCHFGQLNLLDRARCTLVGRADAIFCRNVLIYLDGVSRRQVVNTFYDRLRPEGYLMLGHSESLVNETTAFELVHLATDMVYRRPRFTTIYPPKGNE